MFGTEVPKRSEFWGLFSRQWLLFQMVSVVSNFAGSLYDLSRCPLSRRLKSEELQAPHFIYCQTRYIRYHLQCQTIGLHLAGICNRSFLQTFLASFHTHTLKHADGVAVFLQGLVVLQALGTGHAANVGERINIFCHISLFDGKDNPFC